MKSNFVLCLAFLALISCNAFLFKNPQPQRGKALKAIPDELIGTYLENQNEENIINIKGPLTITRNSFCWEMSDSVNDDEEMVGILSPDKMVLKKLNEYYVMSLKVENPADQDQDSVWDVYLVKYHDKQLFLYNMDNAEVHSQKVDSVKNITPVTQGEGRITHYFLDPSMREFKKLIADSLFVKVARLEKVK